jgi:tetratricopeptide (TPR) repeat protein
MSAFHRLPVGRLLLLFSVLATAALYSPGLSNFLLFDDHATITPLLDAQKDLRTLAQDHLFTHSGPTGRPVAMGTFLVNARLNGSNIPAWKATNLAIHLLNGVLLYWLLRRLTLRFLPSARECELFSSVVASLWLLHPLHISTVLYTVQRMTMLAALFTTLGLLLYLLARDRYVSQGKGSAWHLAGVVACTFAATFSKENGALLPGYILIIEATCLARVGMLAREHTWSTTASKTLLGILAAGLVIGYSRLGNLDSGYTLRPFTLSERLWTEARVVVEYLSLTLAPRLDAMSFFHDDIVLSMGPWTPPATLLSLLVLSGLLVSAWALRRRVPLYTMGIGIFFTGHLLESTIIPLHLMYEHRQYFPSIGLLLAACALIAWLPMRASIRSSSAVACLALLTLLLSQRALAWSSEWRLYESLLQANPGSPGIAIVVGNSLAEAGEFQVAREILGRFDRPAFRLNIAYLDCLENGKLSPGQLASIGTPQRFDFHERSVIIGLGSASLDGRCELPPEEFIVLTDRWLEPPAIAPHDQTLRLRAFSFKRLGELEQAVEELERLQGRYPQLTESLYLAARWLLDSGDIDTARELARRAHETEQNLSIRPTALSRTVSTRLGLPDH